MFKSSIGGELYRKPRKRRAGRGNPDPGQVSPVQRVSNFRSAGPAQFNPCCWATIAGKSISFQNKLTVTASELVLRLLKEFLVIGKEDQDGG
jgi:hypothetical protein